MFGLPSDRVELGGVGATVLLIIFLLGTWGRAQTPTGAIAGLVTDSSGARLAGAQVRAANRETGLLRTSTTSADGSYSAPGLPPGEYQVTAEFSGFKRLQQTATVDVGTTTTLDLALEVGDVQEAVIVSGAASLLDHDDHQVGGVVSRDEIQSLPLNGRNFLDLAKLEPGVTAPVRGTNNRVFLSALGSGLQTSPRVGSTRVTVDGASIDFVGTIGASLQVSQEAVQEFQIATINFDPSASLTTNGAINIVTRSGGNTYHGGAFYFDRNHDLAAYPGLSRDPSNPDPFFERRQFGSSIGGPIRKDQAFFFGTYERNDQHGVVSVQPTTPEFAPLGGIFPSPYLGNQFTGRVDVRLNARHNAFARYTHDGNSAFAPLNDATNILPSGWSLTTNAADQSVAGVTSVLSKSLINDLRLSYFFINSPEQPGGQADCPGCFGLGAPRITIPDAGVTFGNPRTVTFVGHRSQVTESLMWQAGSHRLHVGADWEHSINTSSTVNQEPAQLTLWSPASVRQLTPAIQLPASFTSLGDVLQLPLQSFQTGVGPGETPQRDFLPYRVLDLYRLYAADTWRVGARLTVNSGLSWSYEPNALNEDLTKSALLVPILGAGGLNAPPAQTRNFSPTLGFAWDATSDGKTVVRGGAGRYFDPAGSANSVDLANERVALSPLGTGRIVVSGANILWNGQPLNFRQPTPVTAAQLLTILPDIRAALLAMLNPGNQDFSVLNIDGTKQATNLFDPTYGSPSVVDVGLGVQRELARGFVASADLVWRQFDHTAISGIDYNLWGSEQGSVIPACTPQQKTDVHAVCSNGPITFDASVGRARYAGLLVRLDKHVSRGLQFRVSYALGSYVGSNGTGAGTGFNNENWSENYGPLPTDQRHILNVSGAVELPWRLQLAFNISAASPPPFSVYVSGADFNGDGTQNDLLPGTTANEFGRGLGKADLQRLVDLYNQNYAGKATAGGPVAPYLTLPSSYSFGDSFFTQDVRLARTVVAGHRANLLLFGEVFNLLNTANLTGYSGNIANPATFGQPSARVSQVFGSGGPRAFQWGIRASF